MGLANKKYNKLFLKAKYLSAELEEHNELLEEYKREFSEALSMHINVKNNDLKFKLGECAKNLNKGLEGVRDLESDENFELNKESVHPSLKSIYKKIMIKVHPDKLSLIEDLDLKRKYSDLCSKANSAANESDWYLITDIAMQLGIEIDSPTEEHIAGLEKCCSEYEKKINEARDTYPWVWANSSDSERSIVMSLYIKNNF